MHNLHLLLNRLADAGLDFVVVGGFAGVIHGSALVTNDVDVCAVLSAENVAKIRTALADLNPVHRQTHQKLSFLRYPEPGQPLVNVDLKTDSRQRNGAQSWRSGGDNKPRTPAHRGEHSRLLSAGALAGRGVRPSRGSTGFNSRRKTSGSGAGS